MEVFNHSLWLLLTYQSLGFFFYGLYLYMFERRAGRLLFGFFMLSFSINIFLLHLHYFEHARRLTNMFPMLLTTSFASIPLYYLHMKAQLTNRYRFEANEIMHFVPLIVSAITLAPFWYLISSNRPEHLDLIYGMLLLKKHPGNQTVLIETGIIILIILQLVFYFYRTQVLFYRLKKKLDAKNNREIKDFLSGAKVFSYSFFLLILLLLQRNYFPMNENSLSSTLFILAILTLNVGHAFFGISQGSPVLIRQLYKDVEGELPDDEDNKVKYASSSMCDDLKTELITKLELLLNEKQPYLNSKLKLDDIAQELDTNNKYLSQLINENYGKSFSNFINDYRCRRVIDLFGQKEFEEYTLDGIAESAGFNSRSTFVAAFKKYSGKLPSVYRQDLREQQSSS